MFDKANERVDFLKCPELQELLFGIPVVVWNGQDTKEGIISRAYVGMDTKNKAYIAVTLKGQSNLFKYCIKDLTEENKGLETFIINYLYYLGLIGCKEFYLKPTKRVPKGLFNDLYIWTCTGCKGKRPKGGYYEYCRNDK